MLNLFNTAIAGALRVELQGAVCSAAAIAVNVAGNAELDAMSIGPSFLNGHTAQCKLQDNPTFGSGQTVFTLFNYCSFCKVAN